jgi:hypothetical protein
MLKEILLILFVEMKIDWLNQYLKSINVFILPLPPYISTANSDPHLDWAPFVWKKTQFLYSVSWFDFIIDTSSKWWEEGISIWIQSQEANQKHWDCWKLEWTLIHSLLPKSAEFFFTKMVNYYDARFECRLTITKACSGNKWLLICWSFTYLEGKGAGFLIWIFVQGRDASYFATSSA